MNIVSIIKNNRVWSSPAEEGINLRAGFLHIGLLATLIVAVTQFYFHQYSLHQDLAGGALSGKLANILQEDFDLYSIYFPPAEKVWFLIAAQIHDFSGLRLDIVVIAMTCLAIFISAEFAYYIRKKSVGATPLFLISSVIGFALLPIVFKNIFGLREHLVAIGLWPHIVYRLSDPSGTKISLNWRILLGIWMGWTLLFKYFYAIIVLLVELADAAIQRKPLFLFRAENIISGAIVSLYVLYWIVLQPENYNAIAIMKSAIGANLVGTTSNIGRIAATLFYSVPFLIGAKLYKSNSRQILIALIVYMGATLVAALQARWYSHHDFPIILGLILMLWVTLDKFPKWFSLCLCLPLMLNIGKEFKATGSYQIETITLEKSFVSNGISLDNQRVGLLTAHPSPFNQAIARSGGIRWNTNINIAYVAAELKELDLPKNADTIAPPIAFSNPGSTLLHDQMLRLWEDSPPDVIIMNNSSNWPLKHLQIDWKHLFSNDPKFVKIMDNYELSYSHSDNEISYEYYVMRDKS